MSTPARPSWRSRGGACLRACLAAFAADVSLSRGLQRLRRWQQQVLTEFPGYAVILCLGLVFLATAFKGPPPADDLLRHAVAYAWGYSHTAMYPDSTLPAFNLYPLFDHAVGWLTQATSPLASVKLVQLLALVLSMVVLFRVCLAEGSAPEAATLITLLVLAAGVYQRALLGRPEVFAMVWGMSALLVRGSRVNLKAALFVLAGCAVSAGYWMAWLLWPLMLLLPGSWGRRILLGGTVAVFHAVFWHLHSKGAYWPVMPQVTEWNANRLIGIAENGSVFAYIALQPAFWALGLLAILGWKTLASDSTVRSGAVLGAYAVLNMNRYVGHVATALLPASVAGLNSLGWSRGIIASVALLTSMWVVKMGTAPVLAAPPLFKVAPGSKVLAAPGPAVFSIPFANPGTVQVVPAMEVGASTQEVQRLMLRLSDMRLDCAAVRRLALTHIVESTAVSMPSPECLELEAMSGPWRLWKVRPLRTTATVRQDWPAPPVDETLTPWPAAQPAAPAVRRPEFAAPAGATR